MPSVSTLYALYTLPSEHFFFLFLWTHKEKAAFSCTAFRTKNTETRHTEEMPVWKRVQTYCLLNTGSYPGQNFCTEGRNECESRRNSIVTITEGFFLHTKDTDPHLIAATTHGCKQKRSQVHYWKPPTSLTRGRANQPCVPSQDPVLSSLPTHW